MALVMIKNDYFQHSALNSKGYYYPIERCIKSDNRGIMKMKINEYEWETTEM